MTTVIRVGAGNFRSKINNVLRTYQCAVPKAASATFDRAAEQVRNAQRAEIKKVFDRPTPETVNSVRVIKSNQSDNLSNINSTVHLTEFASRVLSQYIPGVNITSGQQEAEILEPVISNLRLSSVQSEIGDLENEFGNIRGLRGGQVFDRILRHPRVFEIDTNAHPWLDKGIWIAVTTEIVLPLFLAVVAQDKKAIYDYFGVAVRNYRDNVAGIWAEEYSRAIQECRQ